MLMPIRRFASFADDVFIITLRRFRCYADAALFDDTLRHACHAAEMPYLFRMPELPLPLLRRHDTYAIC